MKAIRVQEYGEPDTMQLFEMPAPVPGQGEVRVQLVAAGVNFIDIYQRAGLYKGALPFTPGSEGAGFVDAVGPGVTDLKVGDRVAFASHPGAYAEYVIVPTWKLVPVPEGVSLETAAAVMLQGMTAHYLSHSTFRLEPGHAALVHAAAGGVGLLLVQMARRRGAFVIGTASTLEKAQLARAAGAGEVIRYTEQDFTEETRRITDGRGVDVVYDSVGRATFDGSLACLRPRGLVVLFGQSSGPVPPFELQRLNSGGSLYITRPSLTHYIADREELLWRARDLFGWITAGELNVRVGATWDLSDAASAHRALAGRETTGKVLLRIST